MRVPKKVKDQVKKELTKLIDQLEPSGELPLNIDMSADGRVFLVADVFKDSLSLQIFHTTTNFLPESIYYGEIVFDELGVLLTNDGLKKLLLDDDFIDCFAKKIVEYREKGTSYINKCCISNEDVAKHSKILYRPERLREEVISYRNFKEVWPADLNSFDAAKRLKELIEYENPEYYVPLFELEDELLKMVQEFYDEGVELEGTHRSVVS